MISRKNSKYIVGQDPRGPDYQFVETTGVSTYPLLVVRKTSFLTYWGISL